MVQHVEVDFRAERFAREVFVAPGFTGKYFHSENFLATKFTTHHDLY